MLFGQSVFQSVLDRLDAEEEDKEEDVVVAHRIHGLNAGFAADMREGVSAASAQPNQAYMDNMGNALPPVSEASDELPPPQPEAPPEPPPVMPPHLARTAPAEVAAELQISEKDTLRSLHEKRRAFAKYNHPDGVAAAFRDNATMRMKLANLLIDEAMRRLKR